MLTIGDVLQYSNNTSGFRTWMNYGTQVVGGSDNVFFGLKSEETIVEPAELIMDRGDAVVSWGDNAENNSDNLNDFRFIYTASDLGSSNASARAREFDGEEMARISWNGNMGVGNFYNLLAPTGPVVRPARRLEVLDGGRDEPQFRLTFEQTGVVTGGGALPRWTDFKATNTGDLYINPQFNGVNRGVGINQPSPGNSLEIKSWPSNLGSGLRFSDLTSASTPGTANGLVLTVNSFGDVILVPDGGGVCPGGAPNYLLKNNTTSCTSGIIETTAGLVGVGTASPTAKTAIVSTSSSDAHVLLTNANYSTSGGANYFENIIPTTGSTTNQTNIKAYTEGETNGGSVIAGFFETYDRSTSTYAAYGVKGRASAAATNAGYHYISGVVGDGHATNSNQTVQGGTFTADGNGAYHNGVLSFAAGTNGTNRGVYGHAAGAATDNYGIVGYAANATNNYAIYGMAPGGTASSTNTAGFFNGNTYCSGGSFISSDIKLKQNIQPLTNATAIISLLQSKTYEFDLAGYPSLVLPTGIQYGLIAQDVEQVIPGMVKTFVNPAQEVNGSQIPEVNFKAVNYETLIPILVAGFQEQKHELDSLRQVVANFIGQPRSTENSIEPQERITLSDSKAIQLHQNDPNPFSESTVIRFEIPENILSARIIFTDMKGDILKTATIESRGEGSLEVFASDLSSGLYTYTLVCDGKVIDSKKMVKQ